MLQIYDDVATEHVAALAQLILGWSENARSFPSKNIGGWKSSETLFVIDRPEIKALDAEIGEYVRATLTQGQATPGRAASPYGDAKVNAKMHGWAMVNRAGAEHPRHQHYRTRVSGLYYVAAGGERNQAGELDDRLDKLTPTMFEIDPVALAALEAKAHDAIEIVDRNGVLEAAIYPLPGRLVLFPGAMWHRVPKVNGSEPRITIAFDVRY